MSTSLVDRIKKNQANGKETKITRKVQVGDFKIDHVATGYNPENETVKVKWRDGHCLEFKASYVERMFKES